MTPLLFTYSHFTAGMFPVSNKNSFQKNLNITKSPFHGTCNLEGKTSTFKHSLPALAATKEIFVLLSRSRCVSASVTFSFMLPYSKAQSSYYSISLIRSVDEQKQFYDFFDCITCLNFTPLLFPRNIFLHVCAQSRLHSPSVFLYLSHFFYPALIPSNFD